MDIKQSMPMVCMKRKENRPGVLTNQSITVVNHRSNHSEWKQF